LLRRRSLSENHLSTVKSEPVTILAAGKPEQDAWPHDVIAVLLQGGDVRGAMAMCGSVASV